jgi:hypothetical protein
MLLHANAALSRRQRERLVAGSAESACGASYEDLPVRSSRLGCPLRQDRGPWSPLGARTRSPYRSWCDRLDEGEDRVREAYPGSTWERLAEVKRRYDLTNLFRLNQNVAPNS